jgi:hypothetical protein
MWKTLLATSGLGALLLAGCAPVDGPVSYASAASAPVCAQRGMVDYDNNRVITQAEWTGFRDRVFADWDRNRDGRLANNEFGDCWRAGGFMNAGYDADDWDDNFGAFDDNMDGFLDRNEFFGNDEFGLFDRDRDFGIELDNDEWGF